MDERVNLTVEPTTDQRARFRALSPSERYRWFAGLLRTTHGLATPEAKARWRALKQAQSGGFLSIVCALARALDRGDFEKASQCLSPSVSYDTGKTVLHGVEAIIGAYAHNHDWAARTIDRIRYRSRVDGVAPGVACVTFEDHAEHRGERHVYRCQQEMSVGRTKLVETIVHRELDGERDALTVFFSSVGIQR